MAHTECGASESFDRSIVSEHYSRRAGHGSLEKRVVVHLGLCAVNLRCHFEMAPAAKPHSKPVSARSMPGRSFGTLLAAEVRRRAQSGLQRECVARRRGSKQAQHDP